MWPSVGECSISRKIGSPRATASSPSENASSKCKAPFKLLASQMSARYLTGLHKSKADKYTIRGKVMLRKTSMLARYVTIFNCWILLW